MRRQDGSFIFGESELLQFGQPDVRGVLLIDIFVNLASHQPVPTAQYSLYVSHMIML